MVTTHTTNALSVNAAPWLLPCSVAEVAVAGLVQEGVAGVAGRRHLLPGQVLPVHAVAAQVAPLHAGLATLDPGQLGDLGQSSGLGRGAAGHPAGHGGAGCRGRRRLRHPVGRTGEHTDETGWHHRPSRPSGGADPGSG